jgi:pimeloyl-ACP methyl ester carboxylesterase
MAPFPDLVILLPGITGSVLTNSAGKDVWAPSGGAVWRTIKSLGRSVTGLELTSDDADDGIVASRLVPDVTIVPGLVKIDGYSRIRDYLVNQVGVVEGENFFPFPYDWRRDNRRNAERLRSQALDWLQRWRTASGNADARLILIGHSMGGLIARYFVECLDGWRHTHRVVTLGTPHRGSLNAVSFLEQGMKKKVGPFGLDLSPLLRSLPSVYQLLPIYPCVSVDGGAMQRVPDVAAMGVLPHVDAKRAREAREFHQAIQDAQTANAALTEYAEHGPAVLPVVGIEQPTAQSAELTAGALAILNTYNGQDMGGDGTVPRVSGTPIELSDDGREVFAAETHGSLQNAAGTLANVRGALTRDALDLRKFQRADDAATLTMSLDDVVLPGETLLVRVMASEGNPKLQITLTPLAGGAPIEDALVRDGNEGWQRGEFALPAGAYRVTAHGARATPVSDLIVVAEP